MPATTSIETEQCAAQRHLYRTKPTVDESHGAVRRRQRQPQRRDRFASLEIERPVVAFTPRQHQQAIEPGYEAFDLEIQLNHGLELGGPGRRSIQQGRAAGHDPKQETAAEALGELQKTSAARR